MSSLPANAHTPWPAQTPAPSPSAPLRRKRQADHRTSHSSHFDIQVRSDGVCSGIPDTAQIAEASQQCQTNSSNAVFSCFPTSDTVFAQHQFAQFVWNSQLPYFTETNEVDLYLYNAGTREEILNVVNYTNPTGHAGVYSTCVDDAWFGAQGADWNGQNITYEYFWEISPSTDTYAGSRTPLATFTAVQTTYADSIVASMSSAASASSASAASASSASSAAAASRSAASASATGGTTVGTGVGSGGGGNSSSSANPTSRSPSASSSAGSGTGSVQGLSSDNFPHWAIAVIVVLGFLALVASGILAFFISRRLRNRRNSMLSHRGSMNSAAPMMANAATGQSAQSPLLADAALGAASAEAGEHRPTSPTDGHDGASTMSRTSDAGLFSGADAAIMAAAFRSALRKPDFQDRPGEEGESPESGATERAGGLLNQELAEEGRDIRSVGSSRGVTVETLSDAADNDAATTINHDDDAASTVQDHHH